MAKAKRKSGVTGARKRNGAGSPDTTRRASPPIASRPTTRVRIGYAALTPARIMEKVHQTRQGALQDQTAGRAIGEERIIAKVTVEWSQP